MIITRQKKIPWSWVLMTHLPWAAMLFASAVNTVVFTLEVRKFTANPTRIAMLFTMMGFVWLILSPCIHFISDRVWTRWGRRKIFYFPGIALQVILIPFIPFAPNLSVLVGMFVVNQLSTIITQPKESLAQEVIPNHLRGRGAIIQTIFVQTGLFAYNIALIGRFDDVLFDTPLSGFFGGLLRGEHLMFWVFSAALLSVIFIVGLGIKEMKPKNFSSLREDLGGKITLWRFVKKLFIDCFAGSLWPIYLLIVARVLYAMNLGAMVVLMYTDQWGYSTQDMGTNQALSMIMSMAAMTFLFPLIDRYNRLKTFKSIISFGLTLKLAWYVFVMFFCPDNRPALWQILLIGESIGIVGHFASAVCSPLIYEFVPIDRLGTANAGIGMVGGLLGTLIWPLIGAWITFFSTLLYPAAGNNASTVLAQNMNRAEARVMVKQWEQQTGGTYAATLVTPFGVEAKEGRQWDFRQIDPEAEKIKEKIARIEDRINALKGEIADAEFKKQEDIRLVKQAAMDERVAEVKALDALLEEKALAFRAFLETVLGDRLTDSREAILNAGIENGLFSLDLAIMYPIDDKTISRMVRELALQLEKSLTEVDARSIEIDGKPALRIAAVLKPDAAFDAAIDPAVIEAVNSWVSSNGGLSLTEEQRVLLGEMTQSAASVLTGYRNYAALPFPEKGYKPQTYHYFSAYLLMAITDIGALLILGLISRLEKKGKIKRLGAMESEPEKGPES